MRYNRWIGIMAAGVLALGACQQEKPVVPAVGYSTEAIAFTSPYTKSAQMRSGSFKNGDQVGVLGYCRAMNGSTDNSTSDWDTKKVFAKPDMFYNELLAYEGEGLWTYDHYRNESGNQENGLCPWYENESYTYAFFAYYPYVQLNGNNSGEIADNGGTITLSGENEAGDPVITYTLPHKGQNSNSPLNWENVPDFMLAYKVDHRKSDGPVSLNFRHLLCAFEFEVNNFNLEPVTISQLNFSGTNFYQEVSVTGQQNGYSVGEATYSGSFNILSQGESFTIPAAETDEAGNVTASTVQLTADEAENLISLLFITDSEGRIVNERGSCSIVISATTESGTTMAEGLTMNLAQESSFQAGVRSIFSINIVGNDFILQIRSDNNWEDGGDSDIWFE